MMNFLEQHAVSVTLIISLLGGLFKFWQYIDSKRGELKQKKFENYHKLVERLTAPLSGHEDAYIDIQKAAVFEMRNFPEYKNLTKNIFNEWLKKESKLSEIMKDTLNELK